MKCFIIIFLLAMNNAFAQQPTTGYKNVNGLHMYYEIHGKGYPLVLIHGGGSTIGTTFGRILPEVSKTAMVIAVELQAHGHTRDIDRPLSFEQDADDVSALLMALNIHKADFLGFSNGGSTVMQIAIRHPELVRKAIVCSSFYKREGIYPMVWNFIRDGSIDTMPKELKEAYLKINRDTNGLTVMHDRDRRRMLDFQDWRDDDLRSIKVPTLLVSGDRDVATPEHTIEMYRLIPDCRLAILPGVHGEYLNEITVYREDNFLPSLFVNLIKDFLR